MKLSKKPSSHHGVDRGKGMEFNLCNTGKKKNSAGRESDSPETTHKTLTARHFQQEISDPEGELSSCCTGHRCFQLPHKRAWQSNRDRNELIFPKPPGKQTSFVSSVPFLLLIVTCLLRKKQAAAAECLPSQAPLLSQDKHAAWLGRDKQVGGSWGESTR